MREILFIIASAVLWIVIARVFMFFGKYIFKDERHK